MKWKTKKIITFFVLILLFLQTHSFAEQFDFTSNDTTYHVRRLDKNICLSQCVNSCEFPAELNFYPNNNQLGIVEWFPELKGVNATVKFVIRAFGMDDETTFFSVFASKNGVDLIMGEYNALTHYDYGRIHSDHRFESTLLSEYVLEETYNESLPFARSWNVDVTEWIEEIASKYSGKIRIALASVQYYNPVTKKYEFIESIKTNMDSQRRDNSTYVVFKDVVYTVSFVDSKGNVLSEEEYPLGSSIDAYNIPVGKEDNDYYHYFGKWDKEVVPVTQSATYKLVSIDSSLKRLDVTVEMYDGYPVILSTESECVKANVEDLSMWYRKDRSYLNIDEPLALSSYTYTVFFSVSLDDASEKCADDPYVRDFKASKEDIIVYANGEVVEVNIPIQHYVANKLYDAKTNYGAYSGKPISVFTITFLDSDGETVLKKSAVVPGEMPVAPAVSIKEDNDYYHYSAKWSPEIAAATENATYQLAGVDSSLKRLDITIDLVGGQSVVVKTPSPCIDATALQLEYGDAVVKINKIPSFNLTAGITYNVLLGVSAEKTEACQEDDYVKVIKASDSDVKIFVNGVDTKKSLNAANDYVMSGVTFSGTATYGIKTAQDLRDFAEKVNSGEDPSAWAVLMADIDLNPGKTVLNGDGSLYNNGEGLETWTPIGTESNRYLGTFDGNGYTIRGVYVNGSDKYVGLFGDIGKGSVVKNVGVVDSYIKGQKYVGGIVGENWSGQVANVFNSASVTGYAYVGGVVGFNNGGSIRNSYNAGQVLLDGGNCVGGVVGVTFGTIENCYSIGSVSGTGSYFGGVVGMNSLGSISYSYYSTTACSSCGGAVEGKDDTVNDVVGMTSAELAALGIDEAFKFAEGEENPWTAGSKVTGDGFVTYKFPYLTAFGAKSQPEYSPAIEFATGNASATVYGATTGAVNIPDEIEVSGDITFNRAFPNLDAEDTYSTIMLPFESASKPTGVTFYTIGSVSEVNGKWKVTAVVENGDIAANTPYLVRVASGTKSITFNGGTFKATEGEHSVTSGNWKFVGTYEYKTWPENDPGIGKTYGFAGSNGNDASIVGKFAKVGAGAYIYPMRAYLEYSAPAAGRPAANGAKPAVASLPDEIEVVIVDKDETTGEETTKVVGSLNTRTGEIKFANDRWFDLQGRYLGSKKPTQKGAYYNNGKKVIVK